jgi:hypothetical protein
MPQCLVSCHVVEGRFVSKLQSEYFWLKVLSYNEFLFVKIPNLSWLSSEPGIRLAVCWEQNYSCGGTNEKCLSAD